MAKILVVDDDEDIRAVIDVALDGHQCVMAQDGIEALEILSRGGFDAVVLDVMMPRMDGIDTLRSIRRDKDLKDLPVLMLTAKVGEDDHLRGFRSGADAYLTKPFDPDVLAATVDELRTMSADQREATRDEEKAKALLLRQIERRFENTDA